MADVAVEGVEKATVTTLQGVMGDNGTAAQLHHPASLNPTF